MNFKRAIGIDLLIFLLSLVVNAIAGRILGINLVTTLPKNLPASMWITGILSALILNAMGTIWLFNTPKIKTDAKTGFLYGLLAISLGLVLDMAALMPYKNGKELILGYYTQIQYWLTFLIILMTSTLIGSLKNKKKIKAS